MRKDFERSYVVSDGNVAILTLNHPEVLNAASSRMIRGLNAALDYIESEAAGIRAVVMTGEGRGFCSGANLFELGGDDPAEKDAGHILETIYHPFLRRLRDLPVPLVTAVNGPAVGIGMSIALMGDIVLAARSAYFAQAFARIGLVPDGGSTWLLPRLVGSARAKELSLLAENLPAQTAYEWGLISRICDDAQLPSDAGALARRLANGPTAALSMIRELYWQSPQNAYEEQIGLERRAQQRAGQTVDFAEGVRAFLEKRPPQFVGK